MQQLNFDFIVEKKQADSQKAGGYFENLITALTTDLNFQENGNTVHPAHKIHPFPAKFPPQLPRKFIESLTEPGDVVLDPMMGSGTTLLEAFLLGRKAIGVDIDPLALLFTRVKTDVYHEAKLHSTARAILNSARKNVVLSVSQLTQKMGERFDLSTREFVDYWFTKDVQSELLALVSEIERIREIEIRDFFKLIFSSVIITKSGGVSLAIDLAHTRPHRAKIVLSSSGKIIIGNEYQDQLGTKKHLSKTLRSPIDEFDKKFQQTMKNIIGIPPCDIPPIINYGNAQSLPIASNSIDLIVTSPPYASNAIDYMRAHKFTLVWFGYPIHDLMLKRKTYIGSEGPVLKPLVDLPNKVNDVIAGIAKKSKTKSISLRRYYLEMELALSEMQRVLKPGKAAIVVVGNSTLAGEDSHVEDCLVAIGNGIGFETAAVGVRQLDRNKRMLPAGKNINIDSQIQQRMHEEYVIGFYKPN